MSFYKNTNCPVCGKPFVEGDDIVTCPVCGTPHHRECYMQEGKCANEALHKDGYDYYAQHKEELTKKEPSNSKTNNNVYYKPNTDEKATTNVESSKQAPASPFNPINGAIHTTYDNDYEKIDGKSVSDVAISVGVNAERFIPTFKAFSRKEKKVKWNWSAFFFGSFYLFFRKMYKAGIAFLTLELSTMFLGMAAIFKFTPSIVESMMGFAGEANNTGAMVTPEQMQEIMANPEYSRFVMISNILLVAFILFKVIIGLFANTIYKSQIISNINKVEVDIESGKLNQNIFLYGVGQMPSEDDIKKIYLAKKGSVSFFAPMFAYFAIEAIFLIVSYL